ncbi:MAG TPA: DUF1015 domain-containing protein [Ktedonobacterales bacterium]|nr:DUF1015 domain-containing protein [Ktedonobacterales bacterium]
MADVRPLPGIRYADEAHLAALVTPPYDVISPESQARFYDRDPHNIIRLELGRDEPGDDDLDNRYSRAAATFAEWRRAGVLKQDEPSSFYLYEQRFTSGGQSYARTSLLARVRLEPWDAGVILPHERTLSKPKDDRLKLTRACAATLSPIMSLYDDPAGELASLLGFIRTQEPLAVFSDDAGEEHHLWIAQDDALAAQVAAFFADRQLYIADGHHRYETALTYREEVRALRHDLDEDDAVNFTLMGLSALNDPGLVVLPTHRILRDLDAARLATLDETLAAHFTSEPLEGESADWLRALAAGEAGTAFVLVRPDGARLIKLNDAGARAMLDVRGEDVGASDAWRTLDVAVLHALVLDAALGVTPAAVRAGEHISYTRDAETAATAVRAGSDGAQLAALLNATPPAAIRDVARAGDRMPQKSTYFYPKLITGLVINPLW